MRLASFVTSCAIFLALVFTGLTTSVVFGPEARAEEAFIPPLPEDPNAIDVYLLTVGRGPQIYAVFGHTILRVVDRARGLDMNFNWGIFDFKDPSFIWKFYLGDLRYSMAITDFGSLIAHYRGYEKRSVVQERLNLTNAQKLTLMKRLAWNALPENVHYQYDQFYDNCATKPRDYLDEALGGRLRSQFTKAASPLTFRDHIRGGSNAIWWAYLGLDQLTTASQDAPITSWEEMFLPANLRRHLRDLPALDDYGRPIPGQTLLSETQVLVDIPEPPVGPNPYQLMVLFWGVPMAALLGIAATTRNEARAARALGTVSVLFGFWCAAWGTSMVSNWLVSHYAVAKHNAGLWLMSPLDWTFVGYGFLLIVRGRRPARMRFVRWLALAHIVGFAVLLIGKATSVIRQDAYGMMASTGFLSLLWYAAILRFGTATDGRAEVENVGA